MIVLEGITKEFSTDVVAVSDVDLRVEDGEFVVLVGPSGCGKSTLLHLVAGLEQPTRGSIMIDGRDVTALAPQERDVAVIFQSYALYPHMTVRDNIAFPLRMQHVGKPEIRERVVEVARMLELDAVLDRRPAALSGGQRQRVAMGRAMIRDPRAFLMDEPLSNLDAKLRVQMRGELARLRRRLKKSTIYVTHDQVEAMTLGDRVAVMHDGVVLQFDEPQLLYERPGSLFVARFLGSPAMNVMPARLEDGLVHVGGYVWPVNLSLGFVNGRHSDVIVGIRASAFESDKYCQDRAWPRMEVRVEVVEALGEETLVYFDFPEERFGRSAGLTTITDLERANGEKLLPGFVARVDRRTRVRPGELLRIAVDPEALYFFDARTHEAL